MNLCDTAIQSSSVGRRGVTRTSGDQIMRTVSFVKPAAAWLCLLVASSVTCPCGADTEADIVFLELKDARNAIVDETVEPYFANLQRLEIATLTGCPVTEDSLEACRDEARQRFRSAVLSFSEAEQVGLTWFVQNLGARLDDDYSIFGKQPWKFIKVDNWLCGGFSHTRGPCIIFSQRTVDRFVKAHQELPEIQALKRMGPLMVHEQLHVLQRYYPEKFAVLYEQVFGLQRATMTEHPWLRVRQICNPDAPRHEWIVIARDHDGVRRPFWFRTLLKEDRPIPRMGRDFLMVAVHLEPESVGHYGVVLNDQGVPSFQPLSDLAELKRRWEGVGTVDHPNEMASQLFEQILINDYLTDDAQGDSVDTTILASFRIWCRENLE